MRPHRKAAHMTASDLCASRKKLLHVGRHPHEAAQPTLLGCSAERHHEKSFSPTFFDFPGPYPFTLKCPFRSEKITGSFLPRRRLGGGTWGPLRRDSLERCVSSSLDPDLDPDSLELRQCFRQNFKGFS